MSFLFGTAQSNTFPVVMLSYLQSQFDPSITVQMLIAVAALLILNATYGIDRLPPPERTTELLRRLASWRGRLSHPANGPGNAKQLMHKQK